MRPSSDQAWVACCYLLGFVMAGLPAGAGAQNSPPASSRPAAASPGNYRLGVQIEPVARWTGKSWVLFGLRIVGVSPGSPAERAGIQTGNVLTSVNGSQVTSLQDLLRALENSGGQATLVLYDGRGYTSRQVPSFSWAAPVARSLPSTPPLYYAPPYSFGSYSTMRGTGRVIHRPYYGNYGDAPSPNPFSTPPSYGDIVVP
jgi:membrane-associated protease RseP (regulator of RpoE activity)